MNDLQSHSVKKIIMYVDLFLSPVFARTGVNSRIEGGPWGGRDHGRGRIQEGRGGVGMEFNLLNSSQNKRREKKSMYSHT